MTLIAFGRNKLRLHLIAIENVITLRILEEKSCLYIKIKIPSKAEFHWVRKEVKMAKLKKIAEIKAYYGCEAKEVVETLENKGFLVVDDDENDTVNKIWHVLKNVENQ